MKFRELAEFFERLEKASSRLEMTSILAEMLSSAGKSEIGKAIYLSQGTIAAAHEGLEIGLGESLMINAIAKATGYSKKEVEELYKEKGDLGLAVQEIASKKKQRSLFSEELSLEKTFSNFVKIAKAEGPGSQELKIRLMAELFNSASPLEGKFIARIPVGKMRLGVGEPTIMDALATNYSKEFEKLFPKQVKEIKSALKEKKEEKRRKEFELRLKQRLRELIEEKYNIYSDLGAIAEMLKEKGLKGLEKVEITPGIPIRPTLAERLSSSEEIVKKIGKCFVEQKYDGFRLQVHKNGKEATVFSRQSENVTHMFPEIIKGVQEQLKAKKAIVEGEALAFNEATGEYFPFQVTIQRKRKYDIEKMAEEMPLKLFLFDVMLIENENMMTKKFVERRKALEKLVKPGGVIELTKSIVTGRAKEIDKFFEDSIEKGLEGIIAKDLNAKYIAGARKFAWIKLKRSYKGELSDSIEVVIAGYYKGKGKRAQFGLGGLLSCVYDKDADEFKSIAKIGTGMSEQQMTELEEMLSKTKTGKKPARVDSQLEPDFWVEPKYVIEVRADEITRSPNHTAGKDRTGGLALRFPRMVSFRFDRKPEDATTVKEIKEMFKKQKHVQVEEKT